MIYPTFAFRQKPSFFAEDTSSIGLQCSDPKLAKDRDRLLKWFQWNKLTVNLYKTVYTILTNKNDSSSSLKMDNFVLPPHKSSKYLGVTLD